MLKVADIDAAAADERFLGFGYIGERTTAKGEGQSTRNSDRLLLAIVNELGWDRETFFRFLNSKAGRWFGELSLFGAQTEDMVRTMATKWGLFNPPVAA